MKASIYYGFFLVALFCTLIFPSAQGQNLPTPAYKEAALRMTNAPQFQPFQLTTQGTNLSAYLTKYTLLQLNPTELERLNTERPRELIMSIPRGNGQSWVLNLVTSSPIAEGKGAWTQAGNKAPIERANVSTGLHYHGIVKGDIKSTVAVSISTDRIMGMILDKTGNYDLGITQGQSGNGVPKEYVLYNSFDHKDKLPFKCSMPDAPLKKTAQPEQLEPMLQATCKNVVIYFECDYAMYQANNSNVAQTYAFMAGAFNAMNAIFINENMHILLGDVKIWTRTDPYVNMTSFTAMMNELAVNQIPNNPFTWDFCHLTLRRYGGGQANWFDLYCAPRTQRTCVSSIDNYYVPLPNYCWTVNIMAHELGHLFGSRHTHWCGWVGGQIDGCGYPEGNCNRIGYANPGTIMSYCHIYTSVDLNLGYGPQPGNFIRQCINRATCLTTTTVTAQITFPTQNPYMLTCGNGVQLQAQTGNGYIYQWQRNNIDIPGATQPTYITTQTGAYTIRVRKPGCATVTSAATIILSTPPTPPTLTGLNPPYTNQSPPVTMTATPPGGTFSGPGVTGNIFNPAVAGPGVHNVTYSGVYNGCAYSITVPVQVLACPAGINISPNLDYNICPGNPFTLSVISNPRYSYQWTRNNIPINGATQNTYQPTLGGDYRVIISMMDCTPYTTPPVRATLLNPTPPAINGLNPPYTNTMPPVTMTGVPSGGTFSGPGVIGNTFYPGLVSPGIHNITYYGTENGCGYSITVQVEVIGCPNNTIISPNSPINICRGDSIRLSVPNVIQGTNYQWLLNGQTIPNATSNSYYASLAGQYQVKITVPTCNTYVTPVVLLFNYLPVNAQITGLQPRYNITTPPVTMTGNPSGGTFSGPGVTGNTFNPANAGLGIHTITYSGIQNGCRYSVSVTVEVVTCPTNLDITPNSVPDLCYGDSVLLSVPYDPSFVYSWLRDGTGIPSTNQNSYYVKQSGEYRVKILMLPNCGIYITPPVRVNVSPQIMVQIMGIRNLYLLSNPTAPLMGDPPGGTFSGPGIVGNTFTASLAGLGNHVIRYAGLSSTCPYSLDYPLTVVPGRMENSIMVQSEAWSVYPNPVSNLLKIQSNDLTGNATLELYDSKGLQVYRQSHVISTHRSEIDLDVSTYAGGIYLLKIHQNNSVFTTKIQVENR